MATRKYAAEPGIGKIAAVFGEKGNYWEIYNEVNDKYDEDSMMERLNTNLDNLLIFVSAVASRVGA